MPVDGGSRLPRLGPRGEGWVALQVLLFGVLAAAALAGPAWPDAWRASLEVPAAVLGVAGLVLMAGAFVCLGRMLTPFPRPVDQGALRQDGVYALVRHPIYGGGILLATAVSLGTSWLALLPTALLIVLVELKHRLEERWLGDRHPEYEDYRRRVPKRFIPFVW